MLYKKSASTLYIQQLLFPSPLRLHTLRRQEVCLCARIQREREREVRSYGHRDGRAFYRESRRASSASPLCGQTVYVPGMRIFLLFFFSVCRDVLLLSRTDDPAPLRMRIARWQLPLNVTFCMVIAGTERKKRKQEREGDRILYVYKRMAGRRREGDKVCGGLVFLSSCVAGMLLQEMLLPVLLKPRLLSRPCLLPSYAQVDGIGKKAS